MKLFRNRILLIVLLSAVLLGGLSCQQRDYRLQPVSQRQVVYKVVGGARLWLHVFEPEGRDEKELLPGIVLFHGGGWFMGSPSSLFEHCRYFASRGMVAISAQYRMNANYNTPPYESIEDARSAMRWVRANANKLGIDLDRIAVGGGSAGGHLAVSCAVFDKFDAKGEDLNISCRPDALVLFGSGFGTTEKDFGIRILTNRKKELAWVFGEDANKVCLEHNVKKGMPPAIVLHGGGDDIVPVENAEQFCKLMKEAGNDCRLKVFDGRKHGFYAYKEGNANEGFKVAMRAADRFLRSVGFLKGRPAI